MDIKNIKTRPYSNKILSQNFKPISGIKNGDYRFVTNIYIFIYIDLILVEFFKVLFAAATGEEEGRSSDLGFMTRSSDHIYQPLRSGRI